MWSLQTDLTDNYENSDTSLGKAVRYIRNRTELSGHLYASEFSFSTLPGETGQIDVLFTIVILCWLQVLLILLI